MHYMHMEKVFRLLILALILVLMLPKYSSAQGGALKLALLKYSGGGDWYSDPTALINLSLFSNSELNTEIDPNYATVEVGSPELFNYPWVHMTGHGNVVFSDADADNLRQYLIGGGFLHIDDNYGMDVFVRPAMKKVFPELSFIELPFDHEIYHQKFDFAKGVPKIHEHDDKPSQGFGLFWEDRLICFYTYETDLGDGWEDEEVHNDPPAKRLMALRMGVNIIQYAFSE